MLVSIWSNHDEEKQTDQHSLDAHIIETGEMWRCYLEQAKNFVSN